MSLGGQTVQECGRYTNPKVARVHSSYSVLITLPPYLTFRAYARDRRYVGRLLGLQPCKGIHAKPNPFSGVICAHII